MNKRMRQYPPTAGGSSRVKGPAQACSPELTERDHRVVIRRPTTRCCLPFTPATTRSHCRSSRCTD